MKVDIGGKGKNKTPLDLLDWDTLREKRGRPLGTWRHTRQEELEEAGKK